MPLNSAETKYLTRHYARLIGKTVAKVAYAPDRSIGEVMGLLFTDGTVAWVMSDSEGNGRGFLDIVDGKMKTNAEAESK